MQEVVQSFDPKKLQYHGEHGDMVFRLTKTIGNKKVVVAAEIRKNDVWLLTCFEP